MIARVNGIELYYEKCGTGRPLILLHGNGEDHSIFDEAVELLKDHFTCYAVDSRDHGRSSTVRHLHYADMAADMCAFLELLELEDVVLYGFSDGGIVGLLCTMQFPHVSSLIISGANLEPSGMEQQVFDDILEDYRRTGSEKDRLMLEEPHITPEQLSTIIVPTLVLAGERDMIREAHTQLIAASIPKAVLRILPGEGHETYIIHKTKVAHKILQFILQK